MSQKLNDSVFKKIDSITKEELQAAFDKASCNKEVLSILGIPFNSVTCGAIADLGKHYGIKQIPGKRNNI